MSKTVDSPLQRIERGGAPHPVWHGALLLAGLAVATAVWIDPEAMAAGKEAAQLRIARIGLGLVAAGLVAVWALRRMLQQDLEIVADRYRTAPEPLEPGRLVAALEPARGRPLAWGVAAAWLGAIAIGLGTGAGWVERWTSENGVFETITVLAYLGGAAFAARRLWPALRSGFRPTTLRRWFLLAAAAGCFLIAAEETDWGQTYFDYATPETFEQANIQSDLSLHNLALPESFGVTRWANWVLTLLALGLGGVVPLLLFACAPFRRLVFALDVPLPPYWSQAVLFCAAWIPEIEGRFIRNNVGSELREVTIAVAICVWLANVEAREPR
jgi:hypothetical protein